MIPENAKIEAAKKLFPELYPEYLKMMEKEKRCVEALGGTYTRQMSFVEWVFAWHRLQIDMLATRNAAGMRETRQKQGPV